MELKEMLLNEKALKELVKKETEAIEKLRAKIAYHEKKRRKLYLQSNRFETVIYPLAEEIKKRCGFEYFEIYGPFGLNAETSIYFSNEGEHVKGSEQDKIQISKVETWSLQLTYNDNYESGYQYWNGERTNKYEVGSIGWLNNFDDVYVELPMDINEIIKILRHNHAKKV